jgi:hypothetical protein
MNSFEIIMGVFVAIIITGIPLILYLIEKENKH